MSLKGEYLERKYAEVDDDAHIDGKPSKRRPPKKSKHRHAYRNCLLCWINRDWFVYGRNGAERQEHVLYVFASYCPECGKIGEYDKDDPFYRRMLADAAERGFRVSFVFGAVPPQYIDAALDNYEVFEINDPIKDKYVSFRKDYA